MSVIEWWNALGLASQVFYCIAIPSTLVLVIQTVLMFFGFEDGDADADADVDLDGDIDGDLDTGALDSLHIFTVRGIVAFFVIFGWVGVAMLSAGAGIWITLPVALICGALTMVGIAYLFKAVMRLRNNGTADNRNAVGSAGRVHLTIPASRGGEGKVHVLLAGAYVERNAVTDEDTAIPTGSEIIVVGVSGGTSLIVKRK